MSSQQTLDWAGHCFSWQQDQYSFPDLIISAGEETKLLNAVLAKRFTCDNIYIGMQHGVRSSWYNAVLTLDEPVLPNAVSMNLPPSRLSPDRALSLRCILEEGGDHRDIWGMILGGDRGACQYTDDDWQNLAQAMNALAKKNKIKWLVLTARHQQECNRLATCRIKEPLFRVNQVLQPAFGRPFTVAGCARAANLLQF